MLLNSSPGFRFRELSLVLVGAAGLIHCKSSTPTPDTAATSGVDASGAAVAGTGSSMVGATSVGAGATATGSGGKVAVTAGASGTALSSTAGSGSVARAAGTAAGASGTSASNAGNGETRGAAGGGASMTPACGGSILPIPDDPAVRGPWEVGVKTVKIGRLTVEVVYPAQPGSTAGKPEATYDLSKWLPSSEQKKIPPDHTPPVGPIGGHLYRDVPIDPDHGPYPAIVFIHGTASMRVANSNANVHWASRGNIVLAADYPGLGLTDQLASGCGLAQTGDQDLASDVRAQFSALAAPSGELMFLAGHVDTKSFALGGHSQGACQTAVMADSNPGIKLILPFAGSTSVSPASNLKAIMWIAGMDDSVIGYSSALIGNAVCPANPGPATSDVEAWMDAPGAPGVIKRLVGIKGGGHLSVTDLCQPNPQGKNPVQESQADGVCGVDTAAIIGLPALNDCGTIDWKQGVAATNYASAAAIDEALHCLDRTAAFANMQKAVPAIGDFKHSP